MIDLRSDTVTKPTPAMREAIANAEVGDDVFEDDPTVQKLEEKVAGILGKEAALYVPSGTMANQIAIKVLTQPGDEVLVHEEAHLFYYESGAPSAISGVTLRMLRGDRGMFTHQDVLDSLRPSNDHFAPTTLVCVENTSNRGGGSVWSLDEIKWIHEVAKKNNLKMHLDGARLWNASVASGIPEKEWAKYFDTVSVCFSKGLGAPIGSAIASDKASIKRARRIRKMLGGGMRQVGIIAAGALYAVENNRKRLVDDHANAKRFAEGISKLPGIVIDLDSVETNIILFDVKGISAHVLIDKLQKEGVSMLARSENSIRAVANLNVSREDIEKAIKTFERIL